MGNTYTQIHIQIVFSVQNRLYVIKEDWKGLLYKYMSTIIQKNGHKVLIIGGMPDHIHILIGLRPNQALSHLVQELKRDTSAWINKNNFAKGKFAWQAGFGAMSYSYSDVNNVIAYILNQQEHHRVKTFREEYLAFLEDNQIEYDMKYVFDDI